MTRASFLAIMLLASNAAGCREPEAAELVMPERVMLERAACELAMTQVSAGGHYDKSQIAGCDFASDSDTAPDHYILRLNGFCHEDICGSVLLGWYAVEKEQGKCSNGTSPTGPLAKQ